MSRGDVAGELLLPHLECFAAAALTDCDGANDSQSCHSTNDFQIGASCMSNRLNSIPKSARSLKAYVKHHIRRYAIQSTDEEGSPTALFTAGAFLKAALCGELVRGAMMPFCTALLTLLGFSESSREPEPPRPLTMLCSSCMTSDASAIRSALRSPVLVI